MGDPIEDERTIQNSDGCEDHEQRTSLGLAYIQCGAGVPVFAADPDGLYHWAWLGDHLAAWIGVQIDPPLQAMDLPVCVGPAHDAETACPLRLDVPVAGFLAEPGQSDAYRFSVSDPSLDIAADLTDLPADYDLYLVDGEGAIRAQSAEDGTSPERVAQSLTQGTYYLYVHVDPGRAATPDQPYLLRLSLEPPPAVAAPANDALPDDQTDR